MWNLIYPIMIIVASNTMYNICSKSINKDINTFASLAITYTVAAVTSFIIYFATSSNKNFITELSKSNWASLVLGIVIIGLESGYLLAYRNGWQMNRVSVTANILLAIILVFVAFILFKEKITARQIAGIVVCAGGLAMISL